MSFVSERRHTDCFEQLNDSTYIHWSVQNNQRWLGGFHSINTLSRFEVDSCWTAICGLGFWPLWYWTWPSGLARRKMETLPWRRSTPAAWQPRSCTFTRAFHNNTWPDVGPQDGILSTHLYDTKFKEKIQWQPAAICCPQVNGI